MTETKVTPSFQNGRESTAKVFVNGRGQDFPAQDRPAPRLSQEEQDRLAKEIAAAPKAVFDDCLPLSIKPDHLIGAGSMDRQTIPYSEAYQPSEVKLAPSVSIPLKGSGPKAGAPTINRLAASHVVGSRTTFDPGKAQEEVSELAASVTPGSALERRLSCLEASLSGLVDAVASLTPAPAVKKAATAKKQEADQ
jgi:hypothetical protein